MELRSRKLKDFIDLDEYEYENRPRKYHTRSFTIQAAKIKTEPMTFYEHEPPTQHSIDYQPIVTLNDFSIEPSVVQVKIEPIDPDDNEESYENVVKRIKKEVTDDEFVEYYRDQLPHRSVSKKSRKMQITPFNGNANRSYCCYLCGKWFRHFCRVKSHMPAHTGERIYSCKICDKRYTNTSSLVAHRRTHLGEVAQRTIPINLNRPNKECFTQLPNIRIADEQRSVVAIKKELSEAKVQSVGSFTEFKLEPVDLGNADLINLEPSIAGLEYVPFVWNEHDWKQPVAVASNPKEMTGANKVLRDQNNTNNMMVMDDQSIRANVNQVQNKVSVPSETVNRSKYLSSRSKSSKLELWQKETIGSEAWFVDILHKPKPQRNLFPSENSRNNRSTQPTTETTGDQSTNGKSNEMAIDHRKLGDIEFIQKNWFEARKWYNRSICHSKSGSAHFAIAYAKRGQCFFNMGMYKQCAVDLKLAEKSGLPSQLLPQLEKHKSTCAITLGSSVEHDKVEPMLDFDADLLFPEMANVIQINYNELHGRHIVAEEAIEVGKIVLIEQGFVATTTDFYERCCICLTGDTNMVPCSKCNKAMVCVRCVRRKFHEMECSLQSNANELLPKVLRSILMAVTRIPKVEEFISFVDAAVSGNCPKVPDTIPDFKSKYRAFLQLIQKPKLKSELFSVALDIRTAILKHEILSRFFGTMKHRRFLSHLILHHIEVIGAFGTKTHDDFDKGHVEITAPIASFFNHSCVIMNLTLIIFFSSN